MVDIENTEQEENINPLEFINKASLDRAQKKLQQELIEKQKKEQQIIQEKIDRKLRDQIREEKETKRIKTIEDALKKGDKIRWEIVGTSLKGFVKNKLIFEIKKGITIYNLYTKDTSLLKEGSKIGYTYCSHTLDKVKIKSEKLLK